MTGEGEREREGPTGLLGEIRAASDSTNQTADLFIVSCLKHLKITHISQRGISRLSSWLQFSCVVFDCCSLDFLTMKIIQQKQTISAPTTLTDV